MRIYKISQRPYLSTILASLFLMVGCSPDPAPETATVTASTPTPQVLRISNGTEPSDLDPHITTGQPEINIILSLFEGLLTRDPATLEILPALADSWQISEDKLTYTFHIRPGVRWSNGDPLTIDDIYYSWQLMLYPSTSR